MKDIRLRKMRISNFKGIRELEIIFDGKDMNILGDNGTGKTSIIDSFTWLLFGKDSLGRADFGIKPTDREGNIIHQLETAVEAVFDVSGTEMTLAKTLSEVWTRKRGAAEAEFTRNENNFYIDGVPKKKAEYMAAIAELINEEVFKIITNPFHFNESMNWRDRRSVLLAICGEISDEEVVASNPELSPILPLLQGKTVADFKDITASSMKRINHELDVIPVKIHEAELAKPSAEALEVNAERREALSKEIEELRAKRSGILNGSEVLQEKQNIKLLQSEYHSIGKDFALGATPEYQTVSKLKERSRELAFELSNKKYVKDRTAEAIEQKKAVRLTYSKEWDEVFGERFTDSTCPTCHRELTEEEVEARRNEFNIKKAQRLDRIEEMNAKIGAEIAELEKALQTDTERIASISSEQEALEKDLATASEKVKALSEAKEREFAEERTAIEVKIASSEALIRRYQESTGEMIRDIDGKIAALSEELSKIDQAAANKALLERQNKRIAELKEQQKHLAAEYAAAEKGLYLAEQFVVAKVNMLNERINRKFKYANFKLFDKQINGGINEVCEVTYLGITYKDLNNAAKINIGLDVINTIAAHYGVTVPIMIDNCESVNELFHTDAQQIRFYVSKDKKLKFNTQEE